jgi:hypothetical protein
MVMMVMMALVLSAMPSQPSDYPAAPLRLYQQKKEREVSEEKNFHLFFLCARSQDKLWCRLLVVILATPP